MGEAGEVRILKRYVNVPEKQCKVRFAATRPNPKLQPVGGENHPPCSNNQDVELI